MELWQDISEYDGENQSDKGNDDQKISRFISQGRKKGLFSRLWQIRAHIHPL